MIAVVERDINRSLSAGEKQTFAFRILAHDIGVFVGRNAVVDFLPGRPGIARAIDMRPQVIESEGVDRRVCGVLIEVAGFDDRNFLKRLKLWRRNVRPMRAAIAGDLNQAIVGTRPDAIDIQRRGRHRVNHAALCGLRRWLRAKLADGLGNFESLARQIRTDLLPMLAAVFRLPQSISGKVKNMRIDGREKHRLSSQHAKIR